jgi:hypothetical protein
VRTADLEEQHDEHNVAEVRTPKEGRSPKSEKKTEDMSFENLWISVQKIPLTPAALPLNLGYVHA